MYVKKCASDQNFRGLSSCALSGIFFYLFRKFDGKDILALFDSSFLNVLLLTICQIIYNINKKRKKQE